MPYTKEEKRIRKAAHEKKYSMTDKGIKATRKKNWKKRNLILDDFDKSYDEYIKETNCWMCCKPFKHTADRCFDHDHRIKNRQNIRGILCRSCNLKDVYRFRHNTKI